jgi:hypothetical protein
MTTDRLAYRALSLAMAAVITVSMLVGIDALATDRPGRADLLACTPASAAFPG